VAVILSLSGAILQFLSLQFLWSTIHRAVGVNTMILFNQITGIATVGTVLASRAVKRKPSMAMSTAQRISAQNNGKPV
jgi:hypothetical protein